MTKTIHGDELQQAKIDLPLPLLAKTSANPSPLFEIALVLVRLDHVAPKCKDHRGVDLISDALPFGGLWYAGPEAVANAVGYAQHFSRSHDAVIHVYDDGGNVIASPKLASASASLRQTIERIPIQR
jgi:hypothetical protein